MPKMGWAMLSTTHAYWIHVAELMGSRNDEIGSVSVHRQTHLNFVAKPKVQILLFSKW